MKKSTAVLFTKLTLFSLGILLGFIAGWMVSRYQSGRAIIPQPVVITPEPSFAPIIITPTEPGDSIEPAFPASPDVACTMEAMQCPDGSFVGRQPPSCEFAACPGQGRGNGSGSTPGSMGPSEPVSTTMPSSRSY